MPDPHAEQLLWFLFGGSRGGINRIRIIELLKEQPYNTNQIAEFLNMDYKSIQHHLTVLEKNNLINKIGERYGILFFISNYLESNIDAYNKIKLKVNSNFENDII
jgi:predicted transcriptional regulator